VILVKMEALKAVLYLWTWKIVHSQTAHLFYFAIWVKFGKVLCTWCW